MVGMETVSQKPDFYLVAVWQVLLAEVPCGSREVFTGLN